MKKLLVSILILISVNAFADQFSDKFTIMSKNMRRNFASNPQIQNIIKNTSQRTVAQCGALGTAMLAHATQTNDENSLSLGVALMESYMLKKAQVQNTVNIENEYQISIESLKRNQSIYTDMCALFLKEISSVIK